MNALKVKFKKEIIRTKGNSIIISVESSVEQNLQYRFFVSYDGAWKMLKDYSEENTCQYDMKSGNRCFIMVQGKKQGSDLAFDYVDRLEYRKKDDKYFIKKIDMISTKKIGNKSMMSFQEKQKKNFELFEEKMKQKSMEDILDPLKTIYNETLKEEQEENAGDDISQEEKMPERVDIQKLDNMKDELEEIEVEPEEIEVIEDEEIEEPLAEDDDYIEIVQDTSVEEENEEGLATYPKMKENTFIENNSEYEVNKKANINTDESMEYIPNYENLVKQASSINVGKNESNTVQSIEKNPQYKISNDSRDFYINRFPDNNYNVEISQEENNELFKEKHTNNIIKGQFNKINNNIKEVANNNQNMDNNKIHGIDTQLQHIQNAQNTIEKQISDMCFEQEISLITDDVVDLFDINNRKEELIKYVLTAPKKDYYKGAQIVCTLLCPNPSETFIRYVLYYNDKIILEKPYSADKTYAFTPPYDGTYKMVFYGKKANSNREYIKVKEIYVADCLPIESIGISCDKTSIVCSQEVTFMTTVVGGRKVVYEFYVYNGNSWKCVQEYNEKSYYTLTPNKAGTYKLLVLAKNVNSKNDYDEFVMCKFDVKTQFNSLTDISSLDL